MTFPILLRDATQGQAKRAGSGQPFVSVSTPTGPSAIRNVVVTPGDGKVTIDWDPPLTGVVAGYNVGRSAAPGQSTWESQKPAENVSQTFLSLVNGHAYDLFIEPYNDSGVTRTTVTSTPAVAPTGTPGGGSGGSGDWESNGIPASFDAPYLETSFFKRRLDPAASRTSAGMANLDTSDGYTFKNPLENVTWFDLVGEAPLTNVNLYNRASSFGNKCATKGSFNKVIQLPVGWQNRYHLSSDGKNNQVNVLLTDGDTIESYQASMACNPSTYVAGRPVYSSSSLTSDGQQGARGASRIGNGGLIRPGDLTAPKIEHMLELVADQKYLYGTANGGSSEPGFQWPALAPDGKYNNPSSGSYYTGSVPQMRMGSIVALPTDYDLDANGITGFVRKVAVALIEYGAVVCDITAWQNNNSAWALSVDSLIHQTVWLGEGWSTNPVKAQWLKLIKALEVVDVSDHPEKP